MASREKNRVLKSQILNLFQKNRVSSLSLLFCHSKSNSVYVHPCILCCFKLHSLPIHLLISLRPVICFKLPITRTFFLFPKKVRVLGSRQYFYKYVQRYLFKISLLPQVIIIRYKFIILPLVLEFSSFLIHGEARFVLGISRMDLRNHSLQSMCV